MEINRVKEDIYAGVDFSKDEVIDYIGGLMEDIIERGHLSYIKWDMNRSVTEAWSSGRDAAVSYTHLEGDTES